MEDSQIILLMQNKPADGIFEAISKYHSLVKTVVTRVLPGHSQDIEECVADTFVGVWKNSDRMNINTTSLKGYLLCTARNVAINRYKALKRHKTIPLDDEITHLVSEDDIELVALLDEDIGHLLAALNELTEPDREIMTRRHFLFESVNDIALMVKLDQIQVKNRLYNAKKRLRQKLVERGVVL